MNHTWIITHIGPNLIINHRNGMEITSIGIPELREQIKLLYRISTSLPDADKANILALTDLLQDIAGMAPNARP